MVARHHRALAYPYDRPGFSYLYDDGEVRRLESPEADFSAGRTAVLAFGSNAAPEQLKRKFGEIPGSVIPVVQAELADFDVVYSAHLTSYGTIPATLAPSPGVRLQTWVTWLDDAQLTRMHESETGTSWGAAVNYAYGYLQDIDLRFDGAPGVLQSVGAYLSNHGALALASEPLAFDVIPATARNYESRSMSDILAAVYKSLAPSDSFDDFITRAVEDPDSRARWTDALRRTAFPLNISNFSRENTKT
jgi:hypothetical protein